jgi:hypothetical protein
MTGDYCDGTASCCGGSPDSVNVGGYGVECAPKQVGAPVTCSGGQSCNPPGNICGGSGIVNAPQDCCAAWYNNKNQLVYGQDKHVCKADSTGIMRCFGGLETPTCTTGWNGTDPLCCIKSGDVCQFRDQCCDGQPCVPDAGGVLRCGGSTTCASFGSYCNVDTDCCSTDLKCLPVGETQSVKACIPASSQPGCKGLTGATCTTATAATDCCSGICTNGKCADWTNGSGGSTTCQAVGGACTVNGDCCAGYSCDIPPGATHGTCAAVSACADTSQSCSTSTPCCSATDTCTGGVCTPQSSCIDAYHVCTVGGTPCCQGSCDVSGVCPAPTG